MTLLNISIYTSNPKTIWVKAFLVVFYSVGVIGLLWPLSHPLFIKLIPIALLLSMGLVLLFHEDTFGPKTIVVFTLIYLSSFIIEAVGVHTGIIFGHYNYGDGLGLKVFDTPLIIGLNWLLLVYTTASVVDRLRLPGVPRVIMAALGMVVYDVILEQMAPALDMWYWLGDVIPFQNYLSWFVLAIIFHALFKLLHIKTSNRLAPTVLICQFLFFLVLLGVKMLVI